MPNVRVDVARSRYNATSKTTGAPTNPNLTGVLGNMNPMLATDYAMLSTAPEPALRSNWFLMVESGTDIVAGDVVTNITLLDGVTPWAGSGIIAGQPGALNVVWWVRYWQESAPGILAYRSIYLERTQVGGPS